MDEKIKGWIKNFVKVWCGMRSFRRFYTLHKTKFAQQKKPLRTEAFCSLESIKHSEFRRFLLCKLLHLFYQHIYLRIHLR